METHELHMACEILSPTKHVPFPSEIRPRFVQSSRSLIMRKNMLSSQKMQIHFPSDWAPKETAYHSQERPKQIFLIHPLVHGPWSILNSYNIMHNILSRLDWFYWSARSPRPTRIARFTRTSRSTRIARTAGSTRWVTSSYHMNPTSVTDKSVSITNNLNHSGCQKILSNEPTSRSW